MEREKYLTETREKFFEYSPSKNGTNSYKCIPGIYRVISFDIINMPHPDSQKIDFQLIMTSLWKKDEKEHFLDELIYEFDFTQLFLSLNDEDLNTKISDFSEEEKLKHFELCLGFKDLKIVSFPHPKNISFIQKLNDIILINNLKSSFSVLAGEKLYPRPQKKQFGDDIEGPVLFVLKNSHPEFYKKLYPGYTVVKIESNNLDAAFSNEWLTFTYFSELNFLRNKLNLIMADTVPIRGYYRFHTIRLDPPRKGSDNQPLVYDQPYQIIGIGNWMPIDKSKDLMFDFNDSFSFEVRLNPLLNQSSTYPSDFSFTKDWKSFCTLAQNFIIKVNDLSLFNNSYSIDWEYIWINQKIHLKNWS